MDHAGAGAGARVAGRAGGGGLVPPARRISAAGLGIPAEIFSPVAPLPRPAARSLTATRTSSPRRLVDAKFGASAEAIADVHRGLVIGETGGLPRPSPQTDRVRWIIRLLSTAPRESFTLAQIARHLNVSKATCMPAVAALTSAGWLVRHPERKTYRLGPALIEIGRAAEQASPTDTFLPTLLELCQAAGTGCIAWQVSNDDLVLTEILGPSGPRPSWAGMERGHRFKPVAPLGAALVAWGDDESIERWLAGSGAADPAVARSRFGPGLAAVRSRGFAVELQDHMQHELFQLIQRLRASGPSAVDDLVETITRRAEERLAGLDYLVGTIAPEAVYEPVSINSAVFDRYGNIELVVCLVDFPEHVSGSEVVRLGELVRDRCCSFTAAIHGMLPAVWPAGS